MIESRGLSVSVIVCTLDREADLALTVSSLLDQTELPEELVVVDAGRSSGVQSRLERQIGDALSLVYTRTSAGLTLQRNTGVRMASGQLVLFLDDDVFLAANFVEVIKGVFSRDEREEIHAVQCRIIDLRRADYSTSDVPAVGASRIPIDRLAAGVLARAFLLTTLGDGSIKVSGFQARAGLGRCAGAVEALSGCACYRRSVFSVVAFDERLSGYGWMEDVDISRQLKAQGMHGYYEPAAVLLHRNSPESRDDQLALGRMMILNHSYLFRKHGTGRPVETAAFVWSCIGLALLALAHVELRKLCGMLFGAIETYVGTRGDSCKADT